LSILESERNKLLILQGFTLVTPNFRGWKAFSTPGALTHIRITWALLPMATQVPGVTPGSPCAYGILGTPYGEVCDTQLFSLENMEDDIVAKYQLYVMLIWHVHRVMSNPKIWSSFTKTKFYTIAMDFCQTNPSVTTLLAPLKLP
jgi:hypothetical protein